MRWIAVASVLGLLLALAPGCQSKVFVSEKDLEYHHLPLDLETTYRPEIIPQIPQAALPATVDDPDRQPRPMSLQEALAICLENGSPSSRGGPLGQYDANMSGISTNPGQTSTLALSGSPLSDRVRVLALYPALAGANMEANLARFDAIYHQSFTGTGTDNITQGLNSFSNGYLWDYASSIIKPMPTGGLAHVSFDTQYQYLNSPPSTVINPLYTSKLTFGFEQPLWRNAGVNINQILPTFPLINGTTLPGTGATALNTKLQTLGNGGLIPDGILLSRIRTDLNRTEFERQIHFLLLNAESAYWSLYQAYGQLYSVEEVMRLAHRLWQHNQQKAVAGTEAAKVGLAQIRGQYEEFRGERLKALGLVLEAERNLRGILGLPVEDGCRIVPITAPSLAPFAPDWHAALCDTFTHRPELIMLRDHLRANQLNVYGQENFLKPDVRFIGSWTPVGFGTRLDGNGTLIDGTNTIYSNNAFRELARDNFNNWTIGLHAFVPIGFRQEHAQLRAARLQLAQSYSILKDFEYKAEQNLTIQYRKTSEYYRRIEAARNERKAYGDAVAARFPLYLTGRLPADALLESQRRFAIAMAKEYEAIAEYNKTLIALEHVKGTIMQHDNVMISEGSLPECAQVRAVDHENKRSKALVLAERADPTRHPARMAVDHDLGKDIGDVPAHHAHGPEDLPPLSARPSGTAPPPAADGKPAATTESKARPSSPELSPVFWQSVFGTVPPGGPAPFSSASPTQSMVVPAAATTGPTDLSPVRKASGAEVSVPPLPAGSLAPSTPDNRGPGLAPLSRSMAIPEKREATPAMPPLPPALENRSAPAAPTNVPPVPPAGPSMLPPPLPTGANTSTTTPTSEIRNPVDSRLPTLPPPVPPGDSPTRGADFSTTTPAGPAGPTYLPPPLPR
jgi:outer membrane protein TolC